MKPVSESESKGLPGLRPPRTLAASPPREQPIMQNTEEIWRLVEAKREDFIALSDRVWGMPELAYLEDRSCAEHAAMLRAQGFRVTEKLADIPTAVMGEAGFSQDAGPLFPATARSMGVSSARAS